MRKFVTFAAIAIEFLGAKMSYNMDAVEERRGGKAPFIFVIILAIMGLFYFFCGFYTIQPIGALPKGVTAVVWRDDGEPFFNSPDALCLERTGGVSLMCRIMAMGQGPVNRIIVRLPYVGLAYDLSTGGKRFDR